MRKGGEMMGEFKLGGQRQHLVAAGFTPAPGAPMNGAVTRFEISEH